MLPHSKAISVWVFLFAVSPPNQSTCSGDLGRVVKTGLAYPSKCGDCISTALGWDCDSRTVGKPALSHENPTQALGFCLGPGLLTPASYTQTPQLAPQMVTAHCWFSHVIAFLQVLITLCKIDCWTVSIPDCPILDWMPSSGAVCCGWRLGHVIQRSCQEPQSCVRSLHRERDGLCNLDQHNTQCTKKWAVHIDSDRCPLCLDHHPAEVSVTCPFATASTSFRSAHKYPLSGRPSLTSTSNSIHHFHSQALYSALPVFIPLI